MSLTRDILATTPFVSPSPKHFANRAAQQGVLGTIPVVGSVVRTVPFVGFFDDRLKYPFLTIGRFFVSLSVTIILSQLTLSQPWKDVVEVNILPVVAPAPTKTEFQETGNFFNDNSKKLQIETEFLINQGINQLNRSSWREALSGTIALPFRFAGFYVFIYFLYLLFGNTIPQLERKYLKKSGNLADFGKDAILMLEALARQTTLSAEGLKRLHALIEQTQKGEGLSQHDREFLKQLALTINAQIQPRLQATRPVYNNYPNQH